MRKDLTVYRVEFPIPDLEAAAGDILTLCPERGLILTRPLPGREIPRSAFGALREVPNPAAPARTFTAPAVPGWN